jgi:hypothetical protein
VKTAFIKTVDGAELVGGVKLHKDHPLKWVGDPAFILVTDPLEVRYRMIDGVATAVFTKYDSYNDSREVFLNFNSIIALYYLKDSYIKIYEDSVKTLQDEAEKKSQKASNIAVSEHEAIMEIVNRAMSNTSLH